MTVTNISFCSHICSFISMITYVFFERHNARNYILYACMYVSTCAHAYKHTYIHAVEPISMHAWILTYLPTSICTYIQIDVCMPTYMHIYRYRLMHSCLQTYDAYTYIYSCRHKLHNHACFPTYILRYMYMCRLMQVYLHTYIWILASYISTYIPKYIMHVHLFTSKDLTLLIYLCTYIHMYIPLYSWMSACINMDVSTHIHTWSMFACIHTHNNIATLA